ncbi:hypothetical protein EIL50_02815 [bacterium NHP-B]|nr:hypothetical protein EIL50_02815 [bacterium NHP-B]
MLPFLEFLKRIFRPITRPVVLGVVVGICLTFLMSALWLFEGEKKGEDAFREDVVHQAPALNVSVVAKPESKKYASCHEGGKLGEHGHIAPLKGKGPFVSFVIFGLGQDKKLVKESLVHIPREFAVAVPFGTYHADFLCQRFYKTGHEVLLDVPLESEGRIQDQQFLSAQSSCEDIARYMDRVRAFRVIGITHTNGTAFTKNEQAMGRLFDYCCQHALFFLDTLATPFSCAERLGRECGLYAITSHVFLDGCQRVTPAFLAKLVRKKKSVVIAILVTRGDMERLAHLPMRVHKAGGHVVPLSAQLSVRPR